MEQELLKIIDQYDNILKWKSSGSVIERVAHVLQQFKQIADNTLWKSKGYLEDVKSQFKALIIISEGLSSREMNHTEKRVIANHLISVLRRMVDQIDKVEYEYSSTNFERYDFFRSQTPERSLHEAYQSVKALSDQQKELINELREKHPDTFKEIDQRLPF